MCGITGIYHREAGRPVDEALLSRMNDRHSHRGPDDSGLYLASGIGLGHRRLTIIDPESGHQPMFNEDRTVVVVFNGLIYNFQDLMAELKARGHRFETRCDTEVIVHAWEEWGERCVERFRGMFAFVLWDENQETLFLARDRLGIKPLYYSELDDGTFLFGSELKSILVHPDVPRRIDPLAVEDYFAYGYVPDPKSIYLDVKKLAPGHRLTIARGRRSRGPEPYWDVVFQEGPVAGEAEAREELLEQLREAVRLRMVADVPLGAFLSGGVDSSSVVALMAEVSGSPVNTCSIGFGQSDYDESRYAAMLAERYETQHHQRRVEADSFDLVDRLSTIYDEPYADSSAMPTYRVCALARERVTVCLSGDGGDELFAGYRRYRWHHYEELVRGRLPDGIRTPVFGLLGSLYPKADWAPKPLRAKSTLEAIARSSAAGYFHSVSILTDGLRERIYSPAMRRELQGYNALEIVRGHMENAPAEHHLAKVQYADLKTYLPGDILTKVDRASMANSLEVRVPILDHHVVEWAARLPADLKLRGREGKYLLKKAMEPYVPPDILYRPKMGFAVPLSSWFRGALRDRVRSALTASTLTDTGLLDGREIAGVLDQHQSGARDHSTAIWALVMFESFLRRVHGGSGTGEAGTEGSARLLEGSAA